MSHVTPSAVFGDISGTITAVFEVLWRVPHRIGRHMLMCTKNCMWSPNSTTNITTEARTSLWIAVTTATFAPLLAHNWPLLLARPRWGIDARDGLIFPPDADDATIAQRHGERTLGQLKDNEYGFHGFLYANNDSASFGESVLEGADVIWLHVHGGGFYAGEARQYHHTYKRWVRRAKEEFGVDLRILAIEYPLSTVKPYPGCIEATLAAYKYVLKSGFTSSQIVIAGDSAGGNGALSTCYRILEEPGLSQPAAVIMLSPWMDLTRATSGLSPNQCTDWLTSFDSEECRTGAIEQYMGTEIKSASDPRVSPLARDPSPLLPPQFLSAGKAEVLFADAEKWAEKVEKALGPNAIECHFAKGQVHTFAIGGWLADSGVEELSDRKLLTFVCKHTCLSREPIF